MPSKPQVKERVFQLEQRLHPGQIGNRGSQILSQVAVVIGTYGPIGAYREPGEEGLIPPESGFLSPDMIGYGLGAGSPEDVLGPHGRWGR